MIQTGAPVFCEDFGNYFWQWVWGMSCRGTNKCSCSEAIFEQTKESPLAIFISLPIWQVRRSMGQNVETNCCKTSQLFGGLEPIACVVLVTIGYKLRGKDGILQIPLADAGERVGSGICARRSHRA